MEINNTANPKSALDALFPQSIDCGEGVEVKPMSLATYALLEKIGSYIIMQHKPTEEEILKSLYICTHDPRSVFKDFDKLDELAFDWASTLPPSMMDVISQAILKQISVVQAVMPLAKETDLKKAQTDG